MLLVPFGQPGAYVPGGRVQGADAGQTAVRIGAPFEQEPGEFRLAGHDGERQHVHAGRPGGVHVDTRGQQRFRHRDVAVACRQHQQRQTPGRRDVQVRAGADEQSRHVRVAAGHGPHQGGVVRLESGRIDVGAVLQQCADHGPVPGPDSGHEGRQPAEHLRGVGVGPGTQQQLGHAETGVLAGPRERRDAVIVGRIRVGPGAQQELGQRQVVPVGGVQQRGCAVGARGVHVGALAQQGSHCRGVLLGCRCDNPQVVAARAERRRAQADGGQNQQRPAESLVHG